MTEINLKVEGMSCQHCVMRVKKAIEGLGGVLGSDVAVGNVMVKFDESKVRKEDIEKAIVATGYKIAG